MSCFSRLHLIAQEEYEDRSYPSPQTQLLWRYEELQDRFFALRQVNAPYRGDDCFGRDDYRYAPVHCFKTVRDAVRALEIAAEDLGIRFEIPEDIQSRDCKGQTIHRTAVLEIVLLPAWLGKTAVA